MESLRIIGALFALVFIGLAIRSRSQGRLSRLNFLLSAFLSAMLMVIAVYPDAITPVLAWFDFRQGESSGRLIGILILSNLMLYLLFLRNAGVADLVNRSLIRTVQAQAKQRFQIEFGSHGFQPILVVIPAYNEAENLGAVLRRVPPSIDGVGVSALVCVDGATDGTEEIARANGAAVAVHLINVGGGAALSTGYQIAQERGVRIVVTMDADGQNLPEELPNLVRPILRGDADLTNGSRVLGRYERDSFIRATGVLFFSSLASLMNRRRITDLSSGYRAIRADKLPLLHLRQQQFHASEFLLDALNKGLRMQEVPITFARRSGGASKKPDPIRYGWGFAKAIVQTWLR